MNALKASPPDFVREEAPAYLTWVRTRPCADPLCIHPGPIQAHHLVSRGSGGSDYSALPVCPWHHLEAHQLGEGRFGERYGVDLLVALAETLAAYIRHLEVARG